MLIVALNTKTCCCFKVKDVLLQFSYKNFIKVSGAFTKSMKKGSATVRTTHHEEQNKLGCGPHRGGERIPPFVGSQDGERLSSSGK